ncbi:MAG: MaoC family dehydratase N-terminal domain-containing protein [Acidimicrobiia bacterium]|nr:MaoC family dehydratase N-terminal domain-containing protein [Acidimicrobiia bacterium]MDH4348582.1 MaoC family dehydratase N-terminal domain-containing protein [Gemmatimonadota bacterium]MDH5290273.1 MaoC family dehydratase N-terminal domain-containing protein [Acidimicrobiia bacterium]
MAAEFELTDQMLATVGVESEPWPVELTTTSVRAFARGVGYSDPRYYDLDAAAAAGHDSLPAPPCYLGTPVFIPGQSDPTFSGPRNAGPSVRHGLKGLLDGGTEVHYERPLKAGDKLFMTSKISKLEVKESKGLGKMLVVTSEQTFTEQETGDVVMRTYGQAIYY